MLKDEHHANKNNQDSLQTFIQPDNSPHIDHKWMEAWNVVQKNISRGKLRSTEPQLFGRLPAPNTAPRPRMGGMKILVPTAPPASDSEWRAWYVPD
ncbi:hypothetical protein K3495_g1570 [Podosphaera aphanis]|nr:hypothetical protein K3495_g1570 [Podosphaera aphanis]